MKNHTKTQQRALELLKARLDPSSSYFTASDDVKAALKSIGPYLDTWVLPLVDYLLAGEAWPGQAEYIRSDHHGRIGRRQAAEQADRVAKAGP